MKIDLEENKVIRARDPLDIIFPSMKARKAARHFVYWLRDLDGRSSKSGVSSYANMLDRGIPLESGEVIKYSRRNFYMTILRILVDSGFIRKNAPYWDEGSRRTLWVYQLNYFDIPREGPSVGFWRLAFQIARKWNKLIHPGSH